jgi:hypothetical protein
VLICFFKPEKSMCSRRLRLARKLSAGSTCLPLRRHPAILLRLAQSERFAKLGTISTLHEIKAAAATLPAEERSELAAWLSESDDVSKIRHQQLRREIRIGLDEIERGEVAPLDIAEVKRKARARWEAERQG